MNAAERIRVLAHRLVLVLPDSVTAADVSGELYWIANEVEATENEIELYREAQRQYDPTAVVRAALAGAAMEREG